MNIKVGDWVIITKSKKNWTHEMNKFVGQIVQVTNVYDNSHRCRIRFKDDDGWQWCFDDGHFQPIKNQIIEVW